MTDPFTPPPDHPLDDDVRARLRERVLAGTGEERAAGRRPWLMPLAAAAAVVVVAGGTALAIGGDGDRAAPPVGSGGTTSEPGTTPTTADAPTIPPRTDAPDTPEATETPTAPTSEDAGPGAPATSALCEPELENVLRGAAEQVSIGDDHGLTVFYTKGSQYTLCTVNGGTVTVHHAKPLSGGGQYNRFELSTDFFGRTDGVLVAGGPVPRDNPDFTVTYTFADGHEESSSTAGSPPDNLWWLVVYRTDDAVAALDGPVSVSVTGAPEEGTFELGATDTCAQANHGC